MNNDFLTTYNQKGLNNLTEEQVNYIIKANKLDTNKISDGYHCFSELYEHRIRLFITLCKALRYMDSESDVDILPLWKSKVHHDGSSYDGWFIMGINYKNGEQISYHLPMSYWDEADFVLEHLRAPEWDGHTAADVLERLKNL